MPGTAFVELEAGCQEQCLGSRRAIFIKDEDGLYTADPKKDKHARFIPKVTVDELIAMDLQDVVVEHAVLDLMKNPDVTVRSRGVMEKCTYCVQRIQRARVDAKMAERPLADGDVKTACQQTCPTQAIVFGDLRDPQSQVNERKERNRNYVLLAELGNKPRTSYLARIRNPHPELSKA